MLEISVHTCLPIHWSPQSVGLDQADKGEYDDYVEWCIEHEDDNELIQELVSGLEIHGFTEDSEGPASGEEMDGDAGVGGSEEGESEEEMLESFPSIAMTMKQVTQGHLKDLINRG